MSNPDGILISNISEIKGNMVILLSQDEVPLLEAMAEKFDKPEKNPFLNKG